MALLITCADLAMNAAILIRQHRERKSQLSSDSGAFLSRTSADSDDIRFFVLELVVSPGDFGQQFCRCTPIIGEYKHQVRTVAIIRYSHRASRIRHQFKIRESESLFRQLT